MARHKYEYIENEHPEFPYEFYMSENDTHWCEAMGIGDDIDFECGGGVVRFLEEYQAIEFKIMYLI